jgi:hypothetical protein
LVGGTAVCVAVLTAVLVGGTGVLVFVAGTVVLVRVGVRVGGMGVLVRVFVGTAVLVLVGVLVGTDVLVAVGGVVVLVGVGPPVLPSYTMLSFAPLYVDVMLYPPNAYNFPFSCVYPKLRLALVIDVKALQLFATGS